MTKNRLLFALVLYFIFQINPCCGAKNSEQEKNKYYQIQFDFNYQKNAIKLSNDENFPLSVSGSIAPIEDWKNSQFYAKVLNFDNKYNIFANRNERWYLGKWRQSIRFWDNIEKGKLSSGSEIIDEVQVKTSVPYFYDGKKIEIYDAKTHKIVLDIDISKFAQVSPEKLAQIHPEFNQKARPNTDNDTKSKVSWNWQWTVVIILVIIAAVFVYWRFRAKKMNGMEN